MRPWRAEPLAFETEVAGRPVMRLHAGEDAVVPEDGLEEAWLVSCRVDAADDLAQGALEDAGFAAVETLVTFERDLDQLIEAYVELDEVEPRHVADVIAIGRTAFTHDRFHVDPLVPDRIADAIKAKWVENGVAGRNAAALVAKLPNGDVAGFILVDEALDGSACTIDLIAVDQTAQGKGIGKRLVLGACAWAVGRAPIMRVGTQAENAASVKLYSRCGFYPVHRAITYHRVRPRVGVAVFARMDSSRLPGKVLTDLAGEPLLARVLDRVRQSGAGAACTLVATSARRIDDPVADFANQQGVSVFRGSAMDVLGRAWALVQELDLDALVRISGDSPFIDPGLIDEAVGAWIADPELEIVTNVHPRTYPPGVSVEVLSADLLDRLHYGTSDAEDREHVTRAVYAKPNAFHLLNVEVTDDRFAGLSLTVDTDLDMARARKLVAALGDKANLASLDSVCIAARQLKD